MLTQSIGNSIDFKGKGTYGYLKERIKLCYYHFTYLLCSIMSKLGNNEKKILQKKKNLVSTAMDWLGNK